MKRNSENRPRLYGTSLLIGGAFTLIELLARKFHTRIEQKRGGSVTRLEMIEPNANTTHRSFLDRV